MTHARPKNLTRILLIAAAILAATPLPSLQAQQSQPEAATLPTFEVVSVKENNSGSNAVNIHRTPDGVHMENIDLALLIRFSWQLNFDGQMINLPSWTKDARYDIDARVAPEDVAGFKALSQAQEWQMVQSILADRFKLAVHHEDQQMPVYNLVLAKNGPKAPAVRPADTAKDGGQSMSTGDDHISMHNDTMTAFAGALTRAAHRTVLDKTALAGKFDVDLKYTPDNPDPAMAKDDATRANSEAPTLFTAVQEQLGLKLESGKGPVPCIVIDHLEKPSEN
jgi:uncharacterized protein (TIGR03435 family)